eukprot:Gb_37869 [translate_table: standard]
MEVKKALCPASIPLPSSFIPHALFSFVSCASYHSHSCLLSCLLIAHVSTRYICGVAIFPVCIGIVGPFHPLAASPICFLISLFEGLPSSFTHFAFLFPGEWTFPSPPFTHHYYLAACSSWCIPAPLFWTSGGWVTWHYQQCGSMCDGFRMDGTSHTWWSSFTFLLMPMG